METKINPQNVEWSNGDYIVSFKSGSKDSADEKYLQALKWLVEQEISFDMTCNNGARTLFVRFEYEEEVVAFRREFTKKGIELI